MKVQILYLLFEHDLRVLTMHLRVYHAGYNRTDNTMDKRCAGAGGHGVEYSYNKHEPFPRPTDRWI